MDVTYDEDKSLRNTLERGLPFDLVHHFEWGSALMREDKRRNYGEPRYVAMGPIYERLHVLVFTPREGSVHVISLRKANQREVNRYERQKPRH